MDTGWIILEWDALHIRGIKFRQTATDTLLDAFATVELPANTGPEQSITAAADRLRCSELFQETTLPAASTADDPVSWQLGILLPRDRCSLRQLNFPAAIPVEELPAIVPLQLATELATTPEQLAVDFLSCSRINDDSQSVWAVALPQHQLQQYRQLAKNLQTELQWVGISCFLWPAIIEDILPPALRRNTTIIATGNTHRLELVAFNAGKLTAVSQRRRISAGPVNLKELLAEYRKLGLPPVTADSNSQSLLLIDGTNDRSSFDQEKIVQELSSQTGCAVHHFEIHSEQSQWDWLNTAELKNPLTADYLPLIAALRKLISNDADQLNLHSPKKVKPPQDRRKLYFGLAITAAVCLLGVACGWWWLKLTALDREIQTLNTQISDSRKFNKENSDLLKQANMLLAIRSHHLQIQTHVTELLATLPDRSQLLLKSWSTLPVSGKTHTKITVQGICQTRQHAEQLADKLDQAGFVVRTPVIRPQEGNGPYAYEFEFEYEVPVVDGTPVPQAKISNGKN